MRWVSVPGWVFRKPCASDEATSCADTGGKSRRANISRGIINRVMVSKREMGASCPLDQSDSGY